MDQEKLSTVYLSIQLSITNGSKTVLNELVIAPTDASIDKVDL